MHDKPQPGSIITVTTKHKSDLLWQEWDINTYENVRVMKNEKWDNPTAIRVADRTSPAGGIRIINMQKVTDLQLTEGDTEQLSSASQVVVVPGSKGNEYTVTIKDGTPVSCTCQGYQFRKTCRHLKEASNLLTQ